MLTHKIIKYTPPPPTVYQPPSNTTAFVPPTQERLDAYLREHNVKVGDWFTYSLQRPKLSAEMCNVVVEIVTKVEDLAQTHGTFKPYLFMGLTGCSDFCRAPDYKYSLDPWCRWQDLGCMVKVPEAEVERMLDDYVQDYIQKYSPRAKSFVR